MTTYFLGRGITTKCLNATLYVLSTDIIHQVTDFSWDDGGHRAHFFRLDGEKDTYFVPDGFASGYSGEGPRGYEEAREWFRLLSIPVTEVSITKSEGMETLDKCSRYEVVNGRWRKLNLTDGNHGRVHGNWTGLRRCRERGLQFVVDVPAYKDRVAPWTRGGRLRRRQIV